MATLATIAREASHWFETKPRTNSDETFVSLKDGRPNWLVDLVHEGHGGILPDDWRYSTIEAALDHIADNDLEDENEAREADAEFADEAVDVYTAARFAWLASHLSRQGYVDEATEDFGPAESVADAVGRGQYLEAREVYESVVTSLVDRLDELEGMIDDEVSSYITSALWPGTFTVRAGLVDVTESLDAKYTDDDVSDEARAFITETVEAFLIANADDVAAFQETYTGVDFRERPTIGNNLYLTRNGHGAGFWDLELGELGDRLTAAAKALGESELYVGDDGKLYLQ